MKYRVECGIETATSLSTIKRFENTVELKRYLNDLPRSVWYVVEYANTNQEIVRRNFGCEGVRYNEGIKCPKAMERGLK